MSRPGSDERRAASMMRFYRSIGYNPLPSRSDAKRPKVAFRRACGWDKVGPDWWLRIPTANIQVMAGVPWRLAAIDLDGPTAMALWDSWTLFRPVPPTWRVASDPSSGMHLWFTIPDGVESCPKRFLWRDDNQKHAAIEVIGDRSLITAPPSRHVRTGRRYRFLPGSSPRTIPRPAEMPDWLLDRVAAASRVEILPPAPIPTPRRSGVRSRFDWREVLAAIPDKATAAREVGLRIVDAEPNKEGWVACRAIGREDNVPSAGFNVHSGFYMEPPDGMKLGLFKIAVATGHARDWIEAMDWFGRRYSAPPRIHREQARQHGYLARTTANRP